MSKHKIVQCAIALVISVAIAVSGLAYWFYSQRSFYATWKSPDCRHTVIV